MRNMVYLKPNFFIERGRGGGGDNTHPFTSFYILQNMTNSYVNMRGSIYFLRGGGGLDYFII